MHLIFNNVNDAFTWMVSGIHEGLTRGLDPDTVNCPPHLIPTVSTPSRYGAVHRISGGPVTITYLFPCQRVLWNPERDCNPFFHLFECLWMLAGRNDVAPLVYFNKKMGEFSDDGKTFWGAYGHRWRHGQSSAPKSLSWIDQIQTAIDILRSDPRSRRTVIQMWEPEDLLLAKSNPSCKDVPCNTTIMLDIRNGLLDPGPAGPTQCLPVADLAGWQQSLSTQSPTKKRGWPRDGEANHHLRDAHEDNQFLDITVINRSNDMVWGCFGANYVHMSFLQEYIACALGVKVGVYHQVTNNLHIYEANWHPEKWLSAVAPDPYMSRPDPYPNPPLFKGNYYSGFDDDNKRMFAFWDSLHSFSMLGKSADFESRTSFFQDVVKPLIQSWNSHLARDYTAAILTAGRISHHDWRLVCTQWLQRRQVKWDTKPRINPQGLGDKTETADDSHSHIPPKVK